MENTRKETPWQMKLVDDVVMCARKKDVLEVELEQWGKDWNEGVQSKHSVHTMSCLNGNPAGSVNMQLSSCHRSSNSNILEAPCRALETCIISGHEDTVWMKQLEGDFEVPCYNRIPPHVNGKIHKRIDQPAILHETETVYCLMYGRSNIQLRKFYFCSERVKNMLFSSYCSNLYMCSLWSNYRKSSNVTFHCFI